MKASAYPRWGAWRRFWLKRAIRIFAEYVEDAEKFPMMDSRMGGTATQAELDEASRRTLEVIRQFDKNVGLIPALRLRRFGQLSVRETLTIKHIQGPIRDPHLAIGWSVPHQGVYIRVGAIHGFLQRWMDGNSENMAL